MNIITVKDDRCFTGASATVRNMMDSEVFNCIEGLAFRIPDRNTRFNFEKVSMRKHLDIATVNTAARFKVENGKILEADLSAGGVAPVPLFLRETSRDRVSLSSQAHYATPGLYFDKSKEKGKPFAYHVAGTALTEVTLDRLRGTYSLDSVKIVHDCGTSINPLIDRGQIEGGLLQGIGWVTLEELKYSNETHALLSDSLATYKIPDIYFVPDEVQIEFLENLSENGGVFNSKAVGEPPFMYGIGTYFALLNALRECNPGIEPEYSTPLSTEKMLLLLEQSSN